MEPTVKRMHPSEILYKDCYILLPHNMTCPNVIFITFVLGTEPFPLARVDIVSQCCQPRVRGSFSLSKVGSPDNDMVGVEGPTSTTNLHATR